MFNHDKILDLGDKYTIVFGLKLPTCPIANDMYIFSTGANGYGLYISRRTAKLKCRFVFKKVGSNDDNKVVDT